MGNTLLRVVARAAGRIAPEDYYEVWMSKGHS